SHLCALVTCEAGATCGELRSRSSQRGPPEFRVAGCAGYRGQCSTYRSSQVTNAPRRVSATATAPLRPLCWSHLRIVLEGLLESPVLYCPQRFPSLPAATRTAVARRRAWRPPS